MMNLLGVVNIRHDTKSFEQMLRLYQTAISEWILNKTLIGVKAMQQELQQKIMGYYIEETKDSLNTIEHHLLNLPNRLDEHQIIDPLLCASNSLVGGAAMLGIDSISRTSCCLKSCFQVLELECPVKVDQKLKDLFMQVFCGLKDLVEYLNHPAGLTDDKVSKVMSKIEPVMEDLVNYVNLLVKRSHDDDRTNIDDEFISLFDDFLLGSH